jgi:hypothetical protein
MIANDSIEGWNHTGRNYSSVNSTRAPDKSTKHGRNKSWLWFGFGERVGEGELVCFRNGESLGLREVEGSGGGQDARENNGAGHVTQVPSAIPGYKPFLAATKGAPGGECGCRLGTKGPRRKGGEIAVA